MKYSDCISESVREACRKNKPATHDQYGTMVAVLLQHAVLCYLVAKREEIPAELTELETISLIKSTLEHMDRTIESYAAIRN